MASSVLRAPQMGAIALTALAVGGAAAASTYLLLRHRASSRNIFVPVGRLANIFIYPIKSIAGIEVPYADCTVAGPVYKELKDRLLLIVKGDYFVSMREEPRLGLIQMTFDDGKLTLFAEGYPSLVIEASDPDERSKPSFTVRMRKFSYTAVEVSEEASRWLRKYLQKDGIRLVRIILDQETLDQAVNRPAVVACHDESAFHVLSKASLDVLLSRLPADSNIGRHNFRPAFFIDECEAHAEDHWERMRIADAVMAFSHRTTRYRVDKSEQGLKKYTSQPLLGISTYHVKHGRVTVGDIVYAVVSPKPLL